MYFVFFCFYKNEINITNKKKENEDVNKKRSLRYEIKKLIKKRVFKKMVKRCVKSIYNRYKRQKNQNKMNTPPLIAFPVSLDLI